VIGIIPEIEEDIPEATPTLVVMATRAVMATRVVMAIPAVTAILAVMLTLQTAMEPIQFVGDVARPVT
jgi:hypothetical protein